jgi:alpha-tubulin suppressor-like RCC1 family protein
VDARGAVKYFLRLARHDELEFHSMSAGRDCPVSLFVGSVGSLRACGVEIQYAEDTRALIKDYHAAPAGVLGLGRGWKTSSGSDWLSESEAQVLAVGGVRMRSVTVGSEHVLALTSEGQVHMWGAHLGESRVAKVPTLFEEAGELKFKRVAAGAVHNAAITDDGKLYTWLVLEHERLWGDAAALGYPMPGLDEGDLCRPRDDDESGICLPTDYDEADTCRPRCINAFAGMRIVSVAVGSGYLFTIVAIDEGVA